MTALITLTEAGIDSGPFDIYSNINNFEASFETGVSREDLLNGIFSDNIPDYTTLIKVVSTNPKCSNSILIEVQPFETPNEGEEDIE